MKTLLHILITIVLTIFVVTLIYIKFPKHLQDPDKEITQTITPPPQPLEEQLLEKMTVEEKVGQLFMFGIDGTTLTDKTKQIIEDYHIGGILLFGKNITNEKQLKNLIGNLQSESKVPLFISIDQEGGIVKRITWNPILTIAQPDINTTTQAYTVAKDRGEILKSLGINMNLAPVVEYITDKNSFMYNRTYRGSEKEVYEKSISTIQGYMEAGIISVPKHFPGHGNTSPDSHYSLPMVNISKNQWDEYIQPFSNIIEKTSVDAIMVGHIKFPNIDTKPATLSYEIITNRLIKQLKYNGLIISDDMEMDALDNIDTPEHTAEQALLAGNDILIYSQSTADQQNIQSDVYNYIVKEVEDGKMNIDEKVLKILRMKIKYHIIP